MTKTYDDIECSQIFNWVRQFIKNSNDPHILIRHWKLRHFNISIKCSFSFAVLSNQTGKRLITYTRMQIRTHHLGARSVDLVGTSHFLKWVTTTAEYYLAKNANNDNESWQESLQVFNVFFNWLYFPLATNSSLIPAIGNSRIKYGSGSPLRLQLLHVITSNSNGTNCV